MHSLQDAAQQRSSNLASAELALLRVEPCQVSSFSPGPAALMHLSCAACRVGLGNEHTVPCLLRTLLVSMRMNPSTADGEASFSCTA
jgi:hypothetical protein